MSADCYIRVYQIKKICLEMFLYLLLFGHIYAFFLSNLEPCAGRHMQQVEVSSCAMRQTYTTNTKTLLPQLEPKDV